MKVTWQKIKLLNWKVKSLQNFRDFNDKACQHSFGIYPVLYLYVPEQIHILRGENKQWDQFNMLCELWKHCVRAGICCYWVTFYGGTLPQVFIIVVVRDGYEEMDICFSVWKHTFLNLTWYAIKKWKTHQWSLTQWCKATVTCRRFSLKY